MEENGAGFITKFSSACDALARSAVIQAAPRIKDILKTVVAHEELYNLFENVSAGYNFDRELAACRVPNGISSVSLRYPENRDSYIALVFNLLFRLESDPAATARFLNEYYYADEGINESYAAFIKEVIPKFKRSVLSRFDKAVSYDEPKKSAFITFNRSEQIANYLSDMINAVNADTGLKAVRKEEFLLTAGGLKSCVSRRDYDYVTALYIGLVNTYAQEAGYADYIAEIGKLLNESGLL